MQHPLDIERPKHRNPSMPLKTFPTLRRDFESNESGIKCEHVT